MDRLVASVYDRRSHEMHRSGVLSGPDAHRAPLQSTQLQTSPLTTMPKILLVEDNEMNRDMLSRRLARKGYEVVCAVDGQQGLDLAAPRAAGPDPDGHEPAGARRLGGHAPAQGRRGTRRRIPVIALTAHAMAGDEQKAREAAATTTTPSPSNCRACSRRSRPCFQPFDANGIQFTQSETRTAHSAEPHHRVLRDVD